MGNLRIAIREFGQNEPKARVAYLTQHKHKYCKSRVKLSNFMDVFSGGHFMKYWGGGECQGRRKIYMSVPW